MAASCPAQGPYYCYPHPLQLVMKRFFLPMRNYPSRVQGLARPASKTAGESCLQMLWKAVSEDYLRAASNELESRRAPKLSQRVPLLWLRLERPLLYWLQK